MSIVDSVILGRSIQELDTFFAVHALPEYWMRVEDFDRWMPARNAWETVHFEYRGMRQLLNERRRDIVSWQMLYMDSESKVPPKLKCRRRLQPLARMLVRTL